MIFRLRFSGLNSDSQKGFSLVEVLIGLVLSGLLMSMVAMVLGQSVTNNEVVRTSAGLSSRMFTLRRILHRDLQNIVVGKSVYVVENGFGLPTYNNFLMDGGVMVEASWDFSANMVRRHEENSALEYGSTYQLLRGFSSWRLELLDGKNGAWVAADQFRNRPLSTMPAIKALRLELFFEDGQSLLLVERIPYANQ
ncbi:PulJ/GspJ family protein [Maridesulfovibrio sp. FT414]|uniref:PulJ/GspJ family protein n=1 Tax=Maridesulfovibrio sp. FT414 TaxID=2979469 RepID=UPI003D809155